MTENFKNLKMLFQPLHGDRVLRIAWHISHNSEHLHARANPPLLGLNLPDAQMQFDNCSLSASPHPIFSNIFGYIDISDIILKVDRNLRQTPCWIQHFTI